jgi:hypothetical protein
MGSFEKLLLWRYVVIATMLNSIDLSSMRVKIKVRMEKLIVLMMTVLYLRDFP